MNNSSFKTITFVVLISVVSKIISFATDILIAYKFGTSYIIDAFYLSLSITTVLFSIVASGFSNSFVSVYVRIPEDEGKKYFFDNVMTILLVFSLIFSFIIFFFSDQISCILGPKFENSKIVSQFIKIVIFNLPFMVVFTMFIVRLTIEDNFIYGSFCNNFVLPIILFISVLLASPKNYLLLGYGRVFAYFTVSLLMIIYALKKDISYNPKIKLNDKSFITCSKLAIPLGFGLIMEHINLVIDKFFASGVGEGVISSLEYANKIQNIFLTLIISSLLSVYTPRINSYIANNKIKVAEDALKKILEISLFLVIPFGVFIVTFSNLIVEIFFQRGAFDINATNITSQCLVYYSIGMPFYIVREIFIRTLGAYQKQKTILKNIFIVVVCNISLNYLLVGSLKYIGIALATSISIIVSTFWIGIDLRKIGLKIIKKDQIIEVSKVTLSSLLSISICSFVYSLISNTINNHFGLMIILLLLFVIFFGTILLILKSKTLKYFFNTLTEFKANKK